jgi:hypothetical protein
MKEEYSIVKQLLREWERFYKKIEKVLLKVEQKDKKMKNIV